MQNDAFWILNNDYNNALSSKKLKEKSLEDAATGCYTYLKFSMIARECAKDSVLRSHEIDQNTKNAIEARIDAQNKAIAELLTAMACVEEGSASGVNNDNCAYGILLPSEMAEYRKELDESSVIDAITGGVGTLIATSSQETQPEENVLITEEEAIEMVRGVLNKFSMGMMDAPPFKDLYTYACIELHDVYVIDLETEGLFDGTAQFETDYCYIIAHYTGGS